jgi:hypothetical protein
MRYKERKIGYYGIQNKRSSESEKKEGKTQQNEYFTDTEVEMLPSRMFKCLYRTESMGDFIKRNMKKK